eukprot:1191931-Prorocentrum_minimum.AAC.3
MATGRVRYSPCQVWWGGVPRCRVAFGTTVKVDSPRREGRTPPSPPSRGASACPARTTLASAGKRDRRPEWDPGTRSTNRGLCGVRSPVVTESV